MRQTALVIALFGATLAFTPSVSAESQSDCSARLRSTGISPGQANMMCVTGKARPPKDGTRVKGFKKEKKN